MTTNICIQVQISEILTTKKLDDKLDISKYISSNQVRDVDICVL